MANTFTTNYNLVKSEIGGDNQNWGTNIHETITEVDAQLVNKLDNEIVKGFTSTVVSFTAASRTITAASGDIFEDFKAGDKVRISGADNNNNNGIHIIASKTSANAIVVTNASTLTDEDAATAGTVTIELVLEPAYIDAGPTTVDSLTVEGATSLQGNTTIGNATSDDVIVTGKIKSDLIPETDGTYDLGGAGAEWQDLHIDGTANIDALVTDGTYALSGSGTIAGCSALTTTATTITMSGYTMGTNGKGTRTVGTGDPSGGSDGDVHYKY